MLVIRFIFLERPTMIMYNINNIRSLFGHKVDVDMIKNSPIVRFEADEREGLEGEEEDEEK